MSQTKTHCLLPPLFFHKTKSFFGPHKPDVSNKKSHYPSCRKKIRMSQQTKLTFPPSFILGTRTSNPEVSIPSLPPPLSPSPPLRVQAYEAKIAQAHAHAQAHAQAHAHAQARAEEDDMTFTERYQRKAISFHHTPNVRYIPRAPRGSSWLFITWACGSLGLWAAG